MSTTTPAPPGFAELRAAHPWPAEPPFPDVPVTGRVPRGLELALEVLSAAGGAPRTVLEIGAELGGSTRAFLTVPGVHVVSVDPWPSGKGFKNFPELRGFRDEEDATLRLFQSFTFAHRDRVVALRGYSPAGPVAVHDAGVTVDLVYIDGDHTFDAVVADLEVCAALFPDAVLTGDDWLFKAVGRPRYEGMILPVQTAVRRWAQRRDHAVVVRGNTWRIDPAQPYDLDRIPLVVPSPLAEVDPAPTRLAGARRWLGRARRAVVRRLGRRRASSPGGGAATAGR